MIKRVLSVFILTLFLASAGSAIYAKTNSAQNFADWYKTAFQQKSEHLGSITASEMTRGFPNVKPFVPAAKSTFNVMIAALRNDSVNNTQAELEKQSAAMIKEINETTEELQQESFDAYTDSLQIEAEITKEVEQMLEELLNE